MSGVSLLQPINLSSLYTLPSAIVASLKAHPIFVEKSKEMVDGNPVYHVALDETGLYLVAKDLVANDIIKAFLRDTVVTDEDLQNWAKAFVGSSSFDGVMTAYGKNNIALTINTLQLDSVESLQGTVGKNDTHFQITDSTVTS